jgi:hypothetical protein
VTGDYVALRGAQLDASGAAGGGGIRVGGDLRGSGALPNAKQTQVDANSTLRADAIAIGNGGQIIVWSDEATRFYGTLSARGGAAAGTAASPRSPARAWSRAGRSTSARARAHRHAALRPEGHRAPRGHAGRQRRSGRLR